MIFLQDEDGNTFHINPQLLPTPTLHLGGGGWAVALLAC